MPLRVVKQAESGTVVLICADGTALSGEDVRARLGLRSNVFAIGSQDKNEVCLSVYGYGHGVGMSQYGADLLADGGADYREILEHYYSGSTLAVLS